MSKKLLIVAAALLTSAVSFAQGWTAPTAKSADIVPGDTIQLLNVAAGHFLNGSNAWGTQTSVDPGLPALYFVLNDTVNTEGSPCYTIKTVSGAKAGQYVFRDNQSGCFIDMGAQNRGQFWTFTKLESGYYKITSPEDDPNYGRGNELYTDNYDYMCFGWMNTEGNTVVTADADPTQEGVGYEWAILDKAGATLFAAQLTLYEELLYCAENYPTVDLTNASAVYNNASSTLEQLQAAYKEIYTARRMQDVYAVLNGATEDDPKDGTSLIVNPDFKTGNVNGWDNTFQGGVNGTNVGYQNNSSYSNGEAVISEGFIEAWANSAFNPNYTFRALGDGQLSQTLPSLPAGKYVLTGCFIANNQDGNKAASGKDLEGVQLFATAGEIDNHSNIATGNGKPELIALTFFSTGGDVTLGLRTSNTNANWIAGDNFTLTYYGEVAVDPHKAILDAYIDECEKNFGDLDELKANKDVKDAFAAVLEEAKTAAEDYEAVKDNLEAEAAKLQASVEEYVTLKNEMDNIESMMGQLEVSFPDLSGELSDYLDELKEAYESCSATSEEIAGISDKVGEKVSDYISENCKEGDDVTALLKNANFDRDFSGWQTTGTAPVWDYQVAERYHAAFSMFQTIKNMPTGMYKFTVQAFERDDNGMENNYVPGTPNSGSHTYLYAETASGEQSVAINNICSGAAEVPFFGDGDGTSSGSWPYDTPTSYGYVPNSMQGANICFSTSQEQYLNELDIVMRERGDLTVGMKTSETNVWVIFDNFRIIYMGNGANVYADAINKKIEEAGAVGDNGTMTAEAEKIIDAAITAGEDAMAGNDSEACIEALSQLDEAIAFAKADQALVAELEHMFTTYSEYLIGEVESSDTEFSDILDKVSSKIDDAQFESQQEVKDLMDEIKAGWSTYVLADNLGATEEEPADVSAIIYNPKGVDPVTSEASANGWTCNANVGVDGNSMEVWNANYDFNQTLINLAPGFYRLKVNGFYRPTGWANRVDANDVDTLAHSAILYAGEASTPLLVIKTDAEAYNELAGVSEDGKWAIPTSMAEAATAFENELYQNILQFEVKEANAKTVIGIRKSEGVAEDWSIFTNFQLEYLGTTTPTEDPTTAIDGIEVAPATLVIYDIAGRRVSKAQKGVYVINGKKVIR